MTLWSPANPMTLADDTIRAGGAGVPQRIRNTFSASAAPTADDDTGDGFAVGSIWIDTTNDDIYVCVDATATAAVWRDLVHFTG